MPSLTPFHLAIQVRNLEEARRFYCDFLGCTEGRSSETWVDLNLYGHQLVCHVNPDLGNKGSVQTHANIVDGHGVPVPHFGIVLQMSDWEKLSEHLKKMKIKFIIEPYIRFKGTAGEQATLFICDPSGNAIEFKSFKDIESQLFKI